MKSKGFLTIVALTLISFNHVSSQTDSRQVDKYALLTMPYNQRPLALYKGQFQTNAGYKFAVRGRTFNPDGNLVILKDIGTASVYHYYFLEVRYGITNFLELAAETNYMRRGIRSVTETYYSTSIDAIDVNTLNETRGMGDILLLATLRLPVNYKWFDFAIRGGMFIPTAKYEPLKPTHTVSDITSANVFTVNYHFNNKNGFGVPVWLVSAAAKFSISKFSFETDLTFRRPLEEGKNIRWDQELTLNKSFTYSGDPYQYFLNQTIIVNAALHYQATGWFNIELNSDYLKSFGGWTEYWGDKYKNRDEYLFTLEPRLEIQISPALTIYEAAGFSLSGKNMDGPFYLFMTVSYNMFPLLKHTSGL